ncbi:MULTISPECIES: alpha/beta fold hydrolase [unclassified Dyella]|uniref:alpha/beta fold hydrolase n=1 Tax=unclassified Dyella TaxID=2634549 RepID=UPI003F900F8C
MCTFKTSDGTNLFYKDWGTGPVVVFSHGWPLSSDAWDSQMQFLATHGYRVIAHDRRGHGRSDQTWQGNNMDQYVADLAELLDHLDVRDAVLIGHSTGGGEVARYVANQGAARVAKAVLVSAVPPIMVKSANNPNGTPLEVFDGIRQSVLKNRSQFYLDLTLPFFGYNRPHAEVSEGVRQSFWLQGMMGSIKGQYDCIREFSEVDYTDDLKRIRVPTLVIHGDDDQIVPIDAAGKRSAELVPNARLKIYAGAPHGLPITREDELNRDLLAFIRE